MSRSFFWPLPWLQVYESEVGDGTVWWVGRHCRWQRDRGAFGRCDIDVCALVSDVAAYVYTRARRVSPPLLRGRMRHSCSSFSRAGSGPGVSCCSPSGESDERSKKASTGSMMDLCAVHTSCWADDSALCCVSDSCDRV